MLDDGIEETKNSLIKTNKACKLICTLMKIIFGLLCVWWLISIGVMCVSLLNPQLFDNGNPVTVTTLIIYTLSGAAMAVICVALIKIFSDASRGCSPFSMLQVGRLRTVSVALLAYAVLEFAMTCNTAFAQQGWIGSSANGTAPTLNLFPFVAAAVIYAFSFVFKYGVLLQELSDETL